MAISSGPEPKGRLRKKLHKRAQPYLEPGEQIHQVFLAQTGPSPLFSLISYWIVIIAGRYAIVVVTDRAIVVLDARKMISSIPKGLRLRGPRETHLGPVSGLWGKIQLDERYWVNKRFHKDVRAADDDLDRRNRQSSPG